MQKTLGEIARANRMAKNLTQKQLAAQLSVKVGRQVSRSYYSQIELDGKDYPNWRVPVDVLKAISDVLGINQDELFSAAGVSLTGDNIPVPADWPVELKNHLQK